MTDINKHMTFDDDKGSADTIVTIGLFIVVVGIIWAVMSQFWNGLIGAANSLINAGMVTTRGEDSFVFLRDNWSYFVVFALLGLFLWAIVNAKETAND